MIVVLTGGLGSGKTLLMSLLAASEMRRGRQVLANYPLHGGEVVRSWRRLFSFDDGVVCWDEAHVDMDSRDFKANKDATAWLLQTRKMKLDLLLTTQQFGQVDKRVRDVTDVLIMCARGSAPGGARTTQATVINLVDLRVTAQFILRHSPELYALYDTMARVYPLSR